MIDIIDKVKCCGCTACASICPKQCISMNIDDEGFKYPSVDTSKCINCGLCEKICPVLNPLDAKTVEPICVACKNINSDIVKLSSSGGAFSAIADYVFSVGGVVVGAAFDSDWSVHHIIVNKKEELYKLRGSKYVQSDLGDVFIQIKNILKEGTLLLFVGTPCQVAGLNKFLVNKPKNLITVDLICHSSPSPKVWNEYLQEISKNSGGVNSISELTFRDKARGWRKFSLLIKTIDNNSIKSALIHEDNNSNIYMRGFLQDLYNRPSCTSCPARNFRSHSDITLGDCWAVEKYYPEYADDEDGLSVLLINTTNGGAVFNLIKEDLDYFYMKYEEVEPRDMHAPLTRSTGPHPNRSKFFRMSPSIPLSRRIRRCLMFEDIKTKFLKQTKNILYRIVGKKIYEQIKRIIHG